MENFVKIHDCLSNLLGFVAGTNLTHSAIFCAVERRGRRGLLGHHVMISKKVALRGMMSKELKSNRLLDEARREFRLAKVLSKGCAEYPGSEDLAKEADRRLALAEIRLAVVKLWAGDGGAKVEKVQVFS